jgi:hypothetical protein
MKNKNRLVLKMDYPLKEELEYLRLSAHSKESFGIESEKAHLRHKEILDIVEDLRQEFEKEDEKRRLQRQEERNNAKKKKKKKRQNSTE